MRGGCKRGSQLYAKKKPPTADIHKALAVSPLFIGIAENFT